MSTETKERSMVYIDGTKSKKSYRVIGGDEHSIAAIKTEFHLLNQDTGSYMLECIVRLVARDLKKVTGKDLEALYTLGNPYSVHSDHISTYLSLPFVYLHTEEILKLVIEKTTLIQDFKKIIESFYFDVPIDKENLPEMIEYELLRSFLSKNLEISSETQLN
jgi:hypothetical protein